MHKNFLATICLEFWNLASIPLSISFEKIFLNGMNLFYSNSFQHTQEISVLKHLISPWTHVLAEALWGQQDIWERRTHYSIFFFNIISIMIYVHILILSGGNTRYQVRNTDLPDLDQVKKQQLELDMEQQTGFKSGKGYVKAIYCHPAYLTYMQSTSCEMPVWMKHKLESRLPGEISITSDMQMPWS